MDLSELQAIHGEIIVTEARELNKQYLERLRKIDGDSMSKTGSISLSGTIAFTSLAMLSSVILAKYTLAFGGEKNKHILTLFFDRIEENYDEAIESSKKNPKTRAENVLSDPPFY